MVYSNGYGLGNEPADLRGEPVSDLVSVDIAVAGGVVSGGVGKASAEVKCYASEQSSLREVFMPIGTVTCSGNTTAVQIDNNPQRAMQLLFAPAANNYWVGDSSAMNSTTGIPVLTTQTLPTAIGPFTSGAINMNQWYAAAASGTTVYFQYTAEE